MKDDRLRVLVEPDYAQMLGLANICFSYLEWDAAWCCEKLQTGYILMVSNKTAGQIANDLVGLAAAHDNSEISDGLRIAAAEFKRLVGKRNGLVHVNPGTSHNGEQRLFRHGEEWTPQMVEDVADEFIAASIVLNHYHNELLSDG